MRCLMVRIETEADIQALVGAVEALEQYDPEGARDVRYSLTPIAVFIPAERTFHLFCELLANAGLESREVDPGEFIEAEVLADLLAELTVEALFCVAMNDQRHTAMWN